MQKTKLSTRGRIVIPKGLRDELGWHGGTLLEVEVIGRAVRLRAKATPDGTTDGDGHAESQLRATRRRY